MSKPLIPKFGSFKPRDIVVTEAQKDRETEVKKSRRRHNDIPGKRSRDSIDESERHHKRHGHRERQEHVRRPSPAPASGLNLGAPYIVDVRGDHENLVYESIHRYSVPPFYRIGGGSVLGAKKMLKINREASNEENGIVLEAKAKYVDCHESHVFSHLKRSGYRLLKVLPEEIADDNQDTDFIPLTKSRKRTVAHSESEGGSDDAHEHYRSIEGKAKAGTRPADQDLQYIEDSDSSGLESSRKSLRYDQVLRQKTMEMSRAVEARPHDVQVWLDLINHQDSLLGQADDGRRKVTNAERRSTADIKIHLYEKAIDSVGSDIKVKERLLIGLMEEGSKFWDYRTQSEKWERISKDNLDSLPLWKRYLDFQQSNFNSFQYEKVRNIYLARIGMLKTAVKDPNKSQQEVITLQEHIVYTILRATIFMRQAGFAELAIGIWQGLLELNCVQPCVDGMALEMLQEFWESEIPRLGEDGALGLKNFLDNGDATLAPDARADPSNLLTQLRDHDLFGDWLMEETIRTTLSREPARTMDEVAEDDPFRVILWSDIKDYMFVLTPCMRGFDKEITLLCNAFLMFCGLPPFANDSYGMTRCWWNESFVYGEMIESDVSLLEQCLSRSEAAVLNVELDAVKDTSRIQAYSQYLIPSPEVLFPTNGQSQYLKPWLEVYGPKDTNGPVGYSFTRNAIQQIAVMLRYPELAEYHLAFESCNEPATIKKAAKSILRQFSTSVHLYNDYALIEASQGHSGVAINVLHAALTMPNLNPKHLNQTVHLWKTWAWLLLDSGSLMEAYMCLLAMPSNAVKAVESMDITAPTLLLRCKQHLVAQRDSLHSNSNDELSLAYTECLALVAYLSPNGEGRNIEASLAVFQSFATSLTSRSADSSKSIAHELLHQSAARLLQYHVTSSHSYRPVIVRDFLTKSLAQFPRNTILLSLYAFNERRLRIDDRVRSLLFRSTLTTDYDCLSSRLFAIQYEIRIGNVHSIHAALENAVSSAVCASNPGVWRLYVVFCASTKQYEKHAVEIFYRGMRACPWSKRFMVVSFEVLRNLMTFGELRGIYNMLGERELRVHVDLEDRLEEWDEARKPRKVDRK